jgi:thiosulfate/3-mercaptopyruvate sulfurtransferase
MMTPLIAVEHLRALLDAKTPVAVLDVRWTLAGPERAAYAAGHVPGAHFVSVDDDLAAPHGRRGVHGRHPLPDRRSFEQTMRRCGVYDEHPVVVYDAQGGTSAARAWWLLRYFGHGDVRLLDGGYPAWAAEGGPVSTEVPAPEHSDVTARPGGMRLLDADSAAALAGTGLLVDARAPERYAGDREPVDPVAGHIPGAVSVPTTEHVGEDGRMLAHEELLGRFQKAGYAGGPVGAYCGSGVNAAHTVLALEVAGVHGAGLYADSWSGWITDHQRPVVTGPEPR